MSTTPGTPVVFSNFGGDAISPFTYNLNTGITFQNNGNAFTAIVLNSNPQTQGYLELGVYPNGNGGLQDLLYMSLDGTLLENDTRNVNPNNTNVGNELASGMSIGAIEQSITGNPALPVYFNADGVLSYGPPPSPTTTDYTQANLSSLLTNVLAPNDLTKLLNHFPNGAVAETDTGGPYTPLPDVPDSSGNQPNLLLLDSSGNTIDLDDFPQAHNIVLEDSATQPELILDGSGADHANLYLQPIPGAGGGHLYQITDNVSKLHIFGSGASLILDDGGTQTVIAKGGGNSFNLEDGTFTLKLGGDTVLPGLGGSTPTANNYVAIENFVNGPVTANITGLSANDVVAFQGVEGDYNITQTTNAAGAKITEVVSNGSEGGYAASVTFNGWHQAVTFADPANGYAAGPVIHI